MLYNPQLDVFLEIAKEGSLSKAAKNLYLSQPALTHRLKQLEKSIGAELFIRTPKGVALSKAGAVLYESAVQIKEFCQKKEEECRRAIEGDNTCIRIGLYHDDQYNALNPINNAFSGQFPEISLQIVPLYRENSQQALTDGLVDVIVYTPFKNNIFDPRTSFTYLAKIQQCVQMPEKHRLAKKPFLLLKDLRGETVLVPQYGIYQDVDDIYDYVRANEPDINLTETEYTLATRYQCCIDNTLLMSPQIFSQTSSPLISKPLNCGFTTYFGLLTLTEHSHAVNDYLGCALKIYKDYRDD